MGGSCGITQRCVSIIGVVDYVSESLVKEDTYMGSVLFRKINVVDVRKQRILPGMDVLVEGKKIAVIAEHIAETADRVIDGEGLYFDARHH